MTIDLEAKKIAAAAFCSVCGEPVDVEQQISDRLAENPTLASDDEIEWVIVCAPCAQRGLCPCCVKQTA